MNKALQVRTLKRIFRENNPDIPTNAIDFEAEVDSSLHLDENLDEFKDKFPVFDWGSP